MDNNCNIDDLEVRKYPDGNLPIDSCRECLFNVMCLDYSTYEETGPASRKTVSSNLVQGWQEGL